MDLSAVRLINIKLSQSVTLPIYAGLSDREVQVWQSQKSKWVYRPLLIYIFEFNLRVGSWIPGRISYQIYLGPFRWSISTHMEMMIKTSISIVILKSVLMIWINLLASTVPDLSLLPPIATKASTSHYIYCIMCTCIILLIILLNQLVYGDGFQEILEIYLITHRIPYLCTPCWLYPPN